jgi:hypothetical protein
MIAKHIPMRAKKQSDYAGLVQYLLGPQEKNERVGQVTVTNCQSVDAMVAAIEVLNTQSMNQRATGDKTYHLILSFRAGEQPDAATLSEIETRVCAALGYAEHQRVSAVHHDTDNLHVHLAINKIHPVRHTMHTPYNDHITLGKVCQQLEHEYGLQSDNHAGNKRPGENKANDMEHHAGVESLLGWIKRECWGEMHAARSWNELHAVLAAHGLQLREQGNGLVIKSDDGTTVKASSLDRSFSKGKLEQRYGSFEADTEQADEPPATKRYERKPVDFAEGTNALYEHYKAVREQQDHGEGRKRELAAARDRKNMLIADAKRNARLKRTAVKLLRLGPVTRKLLFAAVSRALLTKIGEAHQQHAAERRRIQQKYRRLTWADWLRAEAQGGNEEALAMLRSRKGARAVGKNTLSGHRYQDQAMGGIDSVTKHGTVIICAGTTVLRDDGVRLTVTREGDHAGMRTALKVAVDRYGKCLRVDGTAEFREQIVRAAVAAHLNITFDDAVLEARRTELTRAATNKETHHETTQHPEQRRPAERGIPTGERSTNAYAAGGGKPDIGNIGQRPPPQSRNRLRSLSQLGMVRIPGGGAVLLPGDVPRHVEQQGPAADHRVRRPVSRAGRLAGGANQKEKRTARPRPPALPGEQLQLPIGDSGKPYVPLFPAPLAQPSAKAAAAISMHKTSAIAASSKYVFEREQRRLTISDIPKHLVYDGFLGEAHFAGLRMVDGQQLALLERGGEIMVTPVSDATALRLKRLARGDLVTVGKGGSIRGKGRRR